MNLDLAIHDIAFAEGRTLGAAQLLIAKRRNDVALKARQAELDGLARPAPGTGARVDKSA